MERFRAMCLCGGEVIEVEQTDEESKTHNCSKGCCGKTLECAKCKTRFIIALEAPEMGNHA